MQILQPPNWPRPNGFSNGIAARGRLAFIAGQIGWTSTAVSKAAISASRSVRR